MAEKNTFQEIINSMSEEEKKIKLARRLSKPKSTNRDKILSKYTWNINRCQIQMNIEQNELNKFFNCVSVVGNAKEQRNDGT